MCFFSVILKNLDYGALNQVLGTMSSRSRWLVTDYMLHALRCWIRWH